MANTNLSDLSVEQLRKAVQIKEQIAALEGQLAGLLGGKSVSTSTAVAAPSGRRGMSAAARAKIAAAQRARWARVKGGNGKATPKAAKAGKRTMSPAARAKIAAAARARWAKIKAGK